MFQLLYFRENRVILWDIDTIISRCAFHFDFNFCSEFDFVLLVSPSALVQQRESCD